MFAGPVLCEVRPWKPAQGPWTPRRGQGRSDQLVSHHHPVSTDSAENAAMKKCRLLQTFVIIYT